MKIHFFGKSDIGRVRSTNEDYFSSKKINDKEHLFIIADGMGGHQAGEVASKLGTETFVREYRKFRKKRTNIEKSMVQSLKKSNSSILRRSMSDPMKRGMGTTFTALVINGKKATIVHVGDSRIYLIRKNKMRKITTDHTFVEKMLNEGKINEQEARDHPQKNILYQSLGARESYSPEIIKDTEIKQGDIIAMCSDGLNNLVEDKMIKKYALTHDPKEAVNELIKKANEKGGTDNITVQIIRAGQYKKKKTTPKKKKKPASKALALLAPALLITLLVALSREKTSDNPLYAGNSKEYNVPEKAQKPSPRERASDYGQNIFKIDTPNLTPEVAPDHFLFFSGEYIFFRKENRVVGFSLIKQKETETIPLRREDAIIPTTIGSKNVLEDILLRKKSPTKPGDTHPVNAYIFRRSATPFVKYQIMDHNQNKTLVTIQSDPELNSVDYESRTVGFSNLKSPLTPVYMNAQALIFHDRHHYYVIENPVKKKDRELKFYKINNMQYAPQLLTSVKLLDGHIKIIFFNIQKKNIRVFEITKADFTATRKISFEFTEMPLAIEYVSENSVIIYFSFGYIDLKKDNTFLQNFYAFNGKSLSVRRIMMDTGANRRILIDKNNRLFILVF